VVHLKILSVESKRVIDKEKHVYYLVFVVLLVVRLLEHSRSVAQSKPNVLMRKVALDERLEHRLRLLHFTPKPHESVFLEHNVNHHEVLSLRIVVCYLDTLIWEHLCLVLCLLFALCFVLYLEHH